MYNMGHTNGHRVTIRLASEHDSTELRRLAQRDSARIPAAPVLAAFSGGRALAAISISDGRRVADPFLRTAEIVSMLEAKLTQSAGR